MSASLSRNGNLQWFRGESNRRRGSSRTAVRAGGLVVVLCVAGITHMLLSSEQKGMSFKGTVVSKEAESPGSRRSIYLLTIAGEDGKTYEWRVPYSEEGYFYEGDYMVKLPKKSKPAVFRRGKQLRGLPFYLDEEVDQNAPLPGERQSGTGAATAGDPGPPAGESPSSSPAAPALATNPAPGAIPGAPPAAAPPSAQPAPTEGEASRLLEEAQRLWTAGDKAGAIRNSERALEIRRTLYGDNHPLVVDVQNRLAAARQMNNP